MLLRGLVDVGAIILYSILTLQSETLLAIHATVRTATAPAGLTVRR